MSSEESVKKMRSWEADIKAYNKFKSIISAHGGDVGDELNNLIKNYNKDHGDGNPTYKITDYQEEDFLCTPALSRDPKIIRAYLEKIYGTSQWEKISTMLQESWINQVNDVEASHL